MNEQEILVALQGVNAILAAASPIVGAATAIGTSLIKQIRGSGTAIGPFSEEIGKFDGLVALGFGVDEKFRADHGLPRSPNV